MNGWTADASRAARHLAAIPYGSATLKEADAQSMLLESGGMLLACGRLYDVKSEPLGAGVFRMTLALRN